MRKRLIVDTAADASVYGGSFARCVREIARREGLRGFYRAWGFDISFRVFGGAVLVAKRNDDARALMAANAELHRRVAALEHARAGQDAPGGVDDPHATIAAIAGWHGQTVSPGFTSYGPMIAEGEFVVEEWETFFHGRDGTLWAALKDRAETVAAARLAFEQLTAWRGRGLSS